MTNKTVGRINHKGHDHPDTAHARRMCRQAHIEAAERKPRRKSEPKPPQEEPDNGPNLLDLSDLEYLVEGLRAIEEQAQGVATIDSIALSLTLESGLVFHANHNGTSWSVNMDGGQ